MITRFCVMYIQSFSGYDRCDLDSYLVICQLLQKKSGWDKIVALRRAYRRRFHCFESRASGIRSQLFWSLKKFNFEKLVQFNPKFSTSKTWLLLPLLCNIQHFQLIVLKKFLSDYLKNLRLVATRILTGCTESQCLLLRSDVVLSRGSKNMSNIRLVSFCTRYDFLIICVWIPCQ